MEIIIISALTLLNGFFALSEIALVSVKKSRIEALASKWSHRAKIILQLLENPENFLSSVQVGITLIGIISWAYGWATISHNIAWYFQNAWLFPWYEESIALMIAIGGITYFSIVIGELVPKTIAMNNAEKLALFCVPILRYFMILTYPFVKLLSFSTTIILKIFWVKSRPEEHVSEDELISMLKNAGKQWVLDKEESQIHNNIFSFWDQTAKSMITHRNELEWIDINDSIEEIFTKIKDSSHSKFIVADGSLDTVVGIMHLRDFLENQNNPDFNLKDIISEPLVFTEHTPAFKVLNTFKNKKQYIAIVADEFWGTSGIITLHDLMEVIVGNLPDEDEDLEDNIIKRSENAYLVNGKTLIYELNQYFQEEILEDGNLEYTTVSGFIMSEFWHLPKTGDTIEKGRYKFEVIDLDGVKIDKILITVVPIEA